MSTSPRFLTLILTILQTAVAANAAPGPHTVDDKTMALLHLDGAADDATGRARVIVEGNVDWVEGKFGKALRLDGTNGVELLSSAALQPGMRSWVLEAWIKPEREQPPQAYIIGSYPGLGRNYSIQLRGGRLAAAFGADDMHRTGAKTADLSARLFDGQWHHVAVVLDRERNGEIRIYLDRENVTESAGQLMLPIGSDRGEMSAALGAVSPGYIGPRGGEDYRGAIDEVRISSVVRPEFAVDPATPPPPAPPRPPAPAEAKLSPDDPASTSPLMLTPENTVIAVAREVPSGNDIDAAGVLRKWLLKASRVEEGFDYIGQNRPDQLAGKAVLVVGRSEWLADDELNHLGPDGYIIRRKGNVVTIAGQDLSAGLSGVVGFLREFVGVRFYMPGDLFTTLPREHKPPVLRKVDLSVSPYIWTGAAHTWGAPDAARWGEYYALFRRSASHQHTMYARFPPSKFTTRYPEIYPLVEGERYLPDSRDQRWQPCFSEPKLVDAAVESARDFFTLRPDMPYIAFSIQDSHAYCARDLASKEVATQIAKLGEEQGKVQGLSNLYWAWLNKVAERLEADYPDKKIVGLAYASVRMPPPFKLHKNIIAWLVFKMSDIVIDKRFTDNAAYFQGWAEAASAVGQHDWAYGRGYLVPRIYTDYTRHTFLEFEKMGAPIRYAYSEVGVNWGLDGPKIYLLARMWWDPHIDVDAELKEFCDDLFGPSSKPMYDYFKLWETLYCEHLNRRTEQKLYRWTRQFTNWTPEELAMLGQARALMDKARGLAKEDPPALERIDLFDRSFRLTEYLVEIGNSPTRDDAKIAEVRKYAAEVIAPDLMTIARRGKEEAAIKLLDDCIKQITNGKHPPRQ